MKSMINIGNEEVKNDVTIKAMAEAAALIMKAGADSHTEQETIRAALRVMTTFGQVSGATVTNSNFINNPKDSDTVPEAETTHTAEDGHDTYSEDET